jgi:hypothetical protein
MHGRLCCPSPTRKANAGGGMRECHRSLQKEKSKMNKNESQNLEIKFKYY